MNELIREIEEDIRRERFDTLWRRFGKIMVGVSVVVIAVTAVTVIVQDRKRSLAAERTAQLLKGMERLGEKDFKAAISEFGALAADARSPYYGLAMLRKAQAESAAGDKDAAKKTYAALAERQDAFGALARLAVMDMRKTGASAPFHHTRSELKGWQLWEQGRKEEAVAEFTALRDDAEAPASLRERMAETLSHIAPETAAAKDQKGDRQ